MVHQVTPSGAHHEVGVDELFFSTTDAKGVIDQVNSTFVKLSRYDRGRLMGAPHNIIRHPQMPGGAFKAMWDTLESGEPFGAYVRNLAADGSEYSVFATVTPLEDGGYLSVRTRPMCDELYVAACNIYEEALKVEREQLAAGQNRRSAAEAGVTRIGELLGQAGFTSYTEFQYLALPFEIEQLEQSSSGFPHRPNASGGLKDTLDAVEGICTDLHLWMSEQDKLSRLSESLRAVGNRIEQEMNDATVTPQTLAVFENLEGEARSLGQPLQLWLQMQGMVRNTLTKLLEALRKLDTISHKTRFRVAVARLHTSMMANFTADLIDGGPDAQASASAIDMLARALRQGLNEMREQSEEHRALTVQTATYIKQTTYATEVPREILLLWTKSIAGKDLPQEVLDLAPRIMNGIDRAGAALNELKALVERCKEMSSQVHESNIDTLLDVVRENTKGIGSPDLRSIYLDFASNESPDPQADPAAAPPAPANPATPAYGNPLSPER